MARLSEQRVSRAKEHAREHKRYYRTSRSDTPIPARASAYPRATSTVRRRYSPIPDAQPEEDVTCISTLPPAVVYQHESPAYEVESSVAYLSLVAAEYAPVLPISPSIDEIDTFDELETPHLLEERWQGELPIVHRAHREQGFPVDISELATKPPPILAQPNPKLALRDEQYSASPDIDEVIEADTLEPNVLIAKPLPSEDDDYVKSGDLENNFAYKPAFVQHPFDFVRWWLLSPGRLEFLCWLIGGVLLGVVMCVLLLVTGFSTGFMSLGHVAH